MNNILSRISALKKDRSLARFCQETGLNYEKLKKAFHRNTIPDVETLHTISCHFHIDLGWLVSGQPENSGFHRLVGQGLIKFRKEKGWTPGQLARHLGLEDAVLQWYEEGSGSLPVIFLNTLEKKTGVSLKEFINFSYGDPASTTELRVTIPGNIPQTPGIKNEDYVSIPLTNSSIAAGQPIIQEENIEDYVLLHVRAAGKRTDLVASRVDGDSMEPMLHSGDIVVIDRSDKNIARNKMYAVFYEEGLTAKYLELQKDWLILRPINPNSQVQIVHLREQPDPIVGRIIGSWKEL